MIRIAIRWLIAFILLAATYNPTPCNWVRWSLTNYSEQLPLIVLSGLILLIGYIIFLRATLRSIGAFGMALVLALVAALLWGFTILDGSAWKTRPPTSGLTSLVSALYSVSA